MSYGLVDLKEYKHTKKIVKELSLLLLKDKWDMDVLIRRDEAYDKAVDLHNKIYNQKLKYSWQA